MRHEKPHETQRVVLVMAATHSTKPEKKHVMRFATLVTVLGMQLGTHAKQLAMRATR